MFQDLQADGPASLRVTHSTLPEPVHKCACCLRPCSPGEETFRVLVEVTNDDALAGKRGEFVDYPIAGSPRTAPAYVRPSDAFTLGGARSNFILVFSLCSDGCAEALSWALQADDHVVSIEILPGQTDARTRGRARRWSGGAFIEPSGKGGFIAVIITGEYTRSRALKSMIEAHALGRKLGINRYLVDVTASRNRESVIGNYEFATKDLWETPAIDKAARVAILARPDDSSHDFAAAAAQKAGLRVVLFRDRGLAERYLLEDAGRV